MHPDSITDWFAKFAKKHGLSHANPHKFRHTMASILIHKNIDIATISSALGHKDQTTTLKIYGHLIGQHEKKVSKTMGDLFYDDR